MSFRIKNNVYIIPRATCGLSPSSEMHILLSFFEYSVFLKQIHVSSPVTISCNLLWSTCSYFSNSCLAQSTVLLLLTSKLGTNLAQILQSFSCCFNMVKTADDLIHENIANPSTGYLASRLIKHRTVSTAFSLEVDGGFPIWGSSSVVSRSDINRGNHRKANNQYDRADVPCT